MIPHDLTTEAQRWEDVAEHLRHKHPEIPWLSLVASRIGCAKKRRNWSGS